MPLDRKYVIASAVVAFVAWAGLTDWFPTLRWIPHAFVAGVLVTVATLLLLIVTTSTGIQNGQVGNAKRRRAVAPAFVGRHVWEEEKAGLKAKAEYRRPTIFPEIPEFSKSVDGLLDLVLAQYVTSWYRAISPRPLFQHEIDRCIRSALLTTAARFTELDIVEIGVAKILPLITIHMKEFYDAERAVRGKDLSSNVTESEELDIAVAGHYNSGKLHSVAALSQSDMATSQQEHLRSQVERILPIVLPSNMQTSPAVLTMVREIVTCAVFGPILQLLSDPDFWNQIIVNIGGPLLQDRKTVRRVRAALDQHATVSPKSARSSQFPRLRPYDSERQFERFIRAIRHINTISDARRFRSEVMSQLRRDSAAVEGQDAAYLRRLETGKRLLDQKITTLSAVGGPGVIKPKLSVQSTAGDSESASRKSHASLHEVIYDASGLSYFMEYMDRIKLMRLVQFYLVVDGFRNPLEGDNDEAPPDGTVNGSDGLDIAQMYEAYLTQPELRTKDSALQSVRQYLKAGRQPSVASYHAARQAILQTQTSVYNTMKERHFEGFKRSDLYYKWLAIDDSPALSAVQRKQTGSHLSPDGSNESSIPHNYERKSQLSGPNKASGLHRSMLSSTDLISAARPVISREDSRRSLDDSNNNRPALFDDMDDDKMNQSIGSIGNDDSDNDAAQHARDKAKAIDAVQLALDNIVEHEKDGVSMFSDGVSTSVEIGDSRGSAEHFRPGLTESSSSIDRPSIASLGLVGGPRSRGVFVDDLFGEETEKFAEDEREDSDGVDSGEDAEVQEAAPGDLGLAEAIDVLTAEMDKLKAQKNVLDSLTAKAELTNNTAELRILRKSEQSLQREIHRKEMQKRQYVVQESDNSLYGRAAVSIKSVMVGREDDGHEFALYVIEVRKQAGDQMPAATWAVTRRYSQFHELHKRLRARFPSVKDLDFPRRQTLFTLQKDFIQKRRSILERYLRSLLLVPAICRSRELRAFLSQSTIASNGTDGAGVDAKDFVTRIYNSVSDGMEDFLGNIPVLDQLSVAGQNLISAASAQINGANGVNGTAMIDALDPATQDPATAAEAEAELHAYETTKEEEPFVKPICDLFLETFELSKGNSWLRGRTVVVVLHQLLGGTIERKVRDSARNALEDESLAKHIEMIKNIMWPGGKPRPPNAAPRTSGEKARTRKEAALLLEALVPDLAGSVVGKANALAASRKVVALLNNRRLDTHIVFTVLDEILRIVFGDETKA